MQPRAAPAPAALLARIGRMWDLSGRKLRATWASAPESRGAPVFTVEGAWTSRGWTEWTLGFLHGSALLQFDATGEAEFLEAGRRGTLERMAPHVTHMGVHDHGFNVVSTYGTLLRLIEEGRLPGERGDRAVCTLALRASGAVQARRWTRTADGGGFIHSFNGPHSLFVDTLRSLRSLALSHALGHVLLEEGDRPVSLLERLVQHARATARYSVYYGEGRDAYDVPGRVAHESLFNPTDGTYRCPSTQQGYSPFTTWTRGLAWAVLGFAEVLEFLASLPAADPVPAGGGPELQAVLRRALKVTADFYLASTASDGLPYWDTGAPGLAALGDWRQRPADPFNAHEPVDSSAAAIACQGLLRAGTLLRTAGEPGGQRYLDAGLALLWRLLEEPYLSTSERHQGLLLHSVYHRPNGWDHVPAGQRVPCGEASMWGDYHLREAALLAQRLLAGAPPTRFWTRKEAP
jgi:unsaturated chondroitin disaccharide hydrolase